MNLENQIQHHLKKVYTYSICNISRLKSVNFEIKWTSQSLVHNFFLIPSYHTLSLLITPYHTLFTRLQRKTFFICYHHVTHEFQSESKLYSLLECRRTSWSKQALYLKLKWQQWDSNPQPLSSFNEHPTRPALLNVWVFVYEVVAGSNPVAVT